MNNKMIRPLGCMALGLAMLITIAGCAVEILNIKDAPVKTFTGKDLALQQVTKAIVLAGMGLKWEMNVAEPGHIVGTLNLRSHQAVVDITYNISTYSITYKSSRNLIQIDGNGKAFGIHPNYNGWIENLDHAIRTQIIAVEQ